MSIEFIGFRYVQVFELSIDLFKKSWWDLAGVDCALDEAIARQIDVLNEAYRKVNIKWILADTTRTVNADWFNHAFQNTAQNAVMKHALHRGGAADLNIYTVK
ncbi:hypothetical protein C0991_002244 [Blastosporella zonata]|nr:hypothetical protein C0991_002244 [Blastosporella zonata]